RSRDPAAAARDRRRTRVHGIVDGLSVMFAPDAVSDIRTFVSRAVRLDPAALVRFRPEPDHTSLWTVLPFGVLARRTVPGRVADDVTVSATELLESLPGLPSRRVDEQWRGSLPS